MAEETAEGRIGHFRVLGELGRGGMGIVLDARDTHLDRRVALKLLRSDLDSPSARARFLREARSAARLAHPNVVTVYEWGEHEGAPYIAMEYIDGPSLKQLLGSAGPLDLDSLLRLARCLLRAVEAAHALGIIHRDIKPANILIAAGFQPKLVDFGLVREQRMDDASSAGLTRSGMVVGTPAYLAPEQRAGHHGDELTDVFQIGLTLYEAATGRHPYLRDEEPPVAVPLPARTLRPELSESLCRALGRAISLERDKRFQSAGEFLAALDGMRERPPASRRLRYWLIPAGAIALLFLFLSPRRAAPTRLPPHAWVQLVRDSGHGSGAQRVFLDFLNESSRWSFLDRHAALREIGASEGKLPLRDWIRAVNTGGGSVLARDFVARMAQRAETAPAEQTWAMAQQRHLIERLVAARAYSWAAWALAASRKYGIERAEYARLLLEWRDRLRREFEDTRSRDAFRAWQQICQQLRELVPERPDTCLDGGDDAMEEQERIFEALRAPSPAASRLVEDLAPGDSSRPRSEQLCVAILNRLGLLPCQGAWDFGRELEPGDLACLAGQGDSKHITPQEVLARIGHAGLFWAEADVRAEWGDLENAQELLRLAKMFDPDARLENLPPRETSEAP